jgi:phosphoribosyl 1,2-cyclic phosphodiesterase
VILDDRTVLVLDAGSGIRALGRDLVRRKVAKLYLFLTHSHWDHLLGFPFFAPLYDESTTIHVRGGPVAKQVLERYLQNQMTPPSFPTSLREARAELDFTRGIPAEQEAGSAHILPIPLSHPQGGYGFRIDEGGRSLAYIPDNELEHQHEGGASRSELLRFCRGAALLIHDAQYTAGEYARRVERGHSSVTTATDLAVAAEVHELLLFHHDPDREDAAVEVMERTARQHAAGRQSQVSVSAAAEGQEVRT